MNTRKRTLVHPNTRASMIDLRMGTRDLEAFGKLRLELTAAEGGKGPTWVRNKSGFLRIRLGTIGNPSIDAEYFFNVDSLDINPRKEKTRHE